MLFDPFSVDTQPVAAEMALQTFADSHFLTLQLHRLPSGKLRGTFTRDSEKYLEIDVIPVNNERLSYSPCLPHPAGEKACIAFFEWASEIYKKNLSHSKAQANKARIDFERAEQFAKRRRIVIPATIRQIRRTHKSRPTTARRLCDRQLDKWLKQKLARQAVIKRVWQNLPPLDASAYEPWELIPNHAWDRQAVKLLWDGRTDPEIAQALGKGKKTITNRLSELRDLFPDQVPTRNQLKRRTKK